jgi:hypothetical protein
MPKNLLQDMIRPKSLPKEVRDPRGEAREEQGIKEIKERPVLNNPPPDSRVIFQKTPAGGRKNRHALWFVAIIAMVFLIFAVSFLFSFAEVTVNPKEKDSNLNSSFNAVKDSTGDELSFDLVILPGVESKTMPVNGTKDSAIKATGQAVIYNAYSTAPQNLLIDTRLEGSNGKIYKTVKAIIVPGMKGTAPGQVEIGIYANEAGPEYNSTPLDFKVFGFKGTPKYDKFYGRSKGDISGGFKGKEPQITDADKARALADLKSNLQAKLVKNASERIPAGFILFKDAVVTNIDQTPVFSEPKDGSTTISLKGTLYGFILNEKSLTKTLAKDLITNYDDSDVYISNLKSLVFSMPPGGLDLSNITALKNINFTLIGNPKIIWTVDKEKLTANLVGIRKADFNSILAGYPNIASAELKVRPAWKSSFPDKSKNIKIIVNYPNE